MICLPVCVGQWLDWELFTCVFRTMICLPVCVLCRVVICLTCSVSLMHLDGSVMQWLRSLESWKSLQVELRRQAGGLDFSCSLLSSFLLNSNSVNFAVLIICLCCFDVGKSGRSRRFGQAHWTSTERSAELRPNVVCYYETSFTGECTERPENVVVSKHISMHASSQMANYVEKLHCIVYEQM